MRKHGMKGATLIAVATLALTACGSDPASPAPQGAGIEAIEAQRGPGDGPHRGMMRGGMMRGGVLLALADSLELTEAQVAEIEAIHETTRTQMAGLHEQMREIVGVPADSARPGRMRRGERRELSDEQREQLRPLMEGMRSVREQAHENALRVLTAEQRAEFDRLVEAHRDRMRERMHHRGEDGMRGRRGDGAPGRAGGATDA